MAFIVKLYNSSAEKHRVNKNGYLNNELILSGTLKENCDISHPVILVQGEITSAPSYNYCQIANFLRYYFIDRIVIVRANLYEIHCTVDVLMSFKNYILNLTPFVTRWEGSTETLYPDKKLPVKSDIIYTRYDSSIDSPFSNGANAGFVAVVTFTGFPFSVKPSETPPTNNQLPYYDLFYYNYDETDLIRHNNSMCANMHNTTLKFLLLSPFQDNAWGDDSVYLENFLGRVLQSENAANAIMSVRLYPITFTSLFTKITEREDADKLVVLGDMSFPWGVKGTDNGDRVTPTVQPFVLGDNFTDVYYGYMLTNSMETQYKVATIQIPAGDWTNYAGYSKYRIYLPFYGYADLNAYEILGSTLEVWYQIDWDTGKAIIRVINTQLNRVIFTANCIVGQDIAISQTNAAEIEARRSQILDSFAGNVTASGITAIAGALMLLVPGATPASIGMIAGGAAGMATTAANAVGSLDTLIPNTNIGILSNTALMCDLNKPFIIKESSNIQYPTNYEELIGKPYNKIVQLSSILGYAEIGEVHLEGFLQSNSEELDMIEKQLKSGIIL